MSADRGFITGIHQQETAGSVGILSHARGETGLTEKGSLLIARNPGDRDFIIEEMIGRCFTKRSRRITDFRQHGFRNAQDVEELFIPL